MVWRWSFCPIKLDPDHIERWESRWSITRLCLFSLFVLLKDNRVLLHYIHGGPFRFSNLPLTLFQNGLIPNFRNIKSMLKKTWCSVNLNGWLKWHDFRKDPEPRKVTPIQTHQRNSPKPCVDRLPWKDSVVPETICSHGTFIKSSQPSHRTTFAQVFWSMAKQFVWPAMR